MKLVFSLYLVLGKKNTLFCLQMSTESLPLTRKSMYCLKTFANKI